jgi:hypothetical protein
MMNYNELNYRRASIIVLIEAAGRTWHEDWSTPRQFDPLPIQPSS